MIRLLSTAMIGLFLMLSQAWADQHDPRLNILFTKLQAAEEDADADRLVSAIWAIWLLGENDRVSQRLALGTALFQKSRFDQALGIFDQVIRDYPDFSEAWNKRATLYYVMGRLDESLQDVEKTISLEPRHFGALAGAAQIYMAQERWEEALQAYRQATRVNPHLYGADKVISNLEEKLKGI